MASDPDSNPLFQCFRLPQLDIDLSEPEVDAHGEPLCHRRSRGKSRTGCDKCKERRVKCDEKRPSCWNCTRLRLHCGFRKAEVLRNRPSINTSSNLQCDPPRKSGKSFDTLSVLRPPLSNGIYPPINLSHMQLFHHFSTVTSEALIFGPQLWKEKAVPYAFKHEYLMHAMLFTAALHLRHLQPQQICHRKEEMEHFSQFIPSFNAALSGPLTQDNAYALCACSLLILQYSWGCPELTDRELNNAMDGFGNLLGLYSGMRKLAQAFLATIHDPHFYSLGFYRPVEAIRRYSENTNIPLELEIFFTHCCQCPKWSGTKDGNFNIRMDAARRLIPLLSALRLGQEALEASGLMPDIARYVFMLPVVSSEEYGQLLRNNDEASLVILLYYFALVRRLTSGKFWWMRERSARLCEWLLTRLGNKCERCTGWAAEICTM